MEKITQKLRKQIVQDILRIVSIQSFTNTDGIKKCQQEIINISESLGFKSSLLGKGKVLIIEPAKARGTPKLGVITHLDTVPFSKKDWKHNPLGEISNNRIYGRGVLDDKAAIILSLYAFYLLGDSISPSWQILVGSSEEGEWVDMEAYLSEGHQLPSFSITVDGDGVQNGCKGYLDLELKFQRNSDSNQISKLCIPNGVENIVPEKAIAIINGVKFESKGKAAHSSIPSEGKNALINLVGQIRKHISSSEFSGFFKMMEILRTSFNATTLGFFKHSTYLNDQYVGFTTVCPTMCTLEKDCLSMNLNFRLSPGTTSDEVFRAVQDISSKFNCACYIKKLEYPVYVPQTCKEIKYMLEAYSMVMGKETISKIANGIGYNATIPNCVIFGPRFDSEHDEADTCHTVDENRSIDDLFKFFDMLVIFCEKYLNE